MNLIFQGYFGHDKPVPKSASLLKSLSYPGKTQDRSRPFVKPAFYLSPSCPHIRCWAYVMFCPCSPPVPMATTYTILSFSLYFLIFPFLYHLSPLFPSDSLISSSSRSSSFIPLSLPFFLFQLLSLSFIISLSLSSSSIISISLPLLRYLQDGAHSPLSFPTWK